MQQYFQVLMEYVTCKNQINLTLIWFKTFYGKLMYAYYTYVCIYMNVCMYIIMYVPKFSGIHNTYKYVASYLVMDMHFILCIQYILYVCKYIYVTELYNKLFLHFIVPLCYAANNCIGRPINNFISSDCCMNFGSSYLLSGQCYSCPSTSKCCFYDT